MRLCWGRRCRLRNQTNTMKTLRSRLIEHGKKVWRRVYAGKREEYLSAIGKTALTTDDDYYLYHRYHIQLMIDCMHRPSLMSPKQWMRWRNARSPHFLEVIEQMHDDKIYNPVTGKFRPDYWIE